MIIIERTTGYRKNLILKKASELFYENGYDNTPIRLLSKNTELSVAGIYYFFKDKEDILFNILNESIIRFTDSLKKAISEKDDPENNLIRMIRYLLEHVIDNKMELTILNREGNRLNETQLEIIEKHKREAYDLVKAELDKLNKLGRLTIKNLTPAVFIIFSMTLWFARWYEPNGPMTLDVLAEEMTNIFFYGVLKEKN